MKLSELAVDEYAVIEVVGGSGRQHTCHGSEFHRAALRASGNVNGNEQSAGG